MYEYKVFKWDLSTLTLTEELEDTLNDYAKEGWRVLDVITNVKGSGNIIYASLNGNETTFILERVKEN